MLDLWNDSDLALRNASAVAGLLTEVHPDAQLRTLAEQRVQDVDRLHTDRGLDRALFDVVDATDPDGLDAAGRSACASGCCATSGAVAWIRPTTCARGCGRSPSGSPCSTRSSPASSATTSARSRSVPTSLDGLPPDFVEAHPAGDDGLVTITTDYPDYLPFRTFARDAAARRELTVEFLNRAWPDNDAVLHEMLALRDERARMLGLRRAGPTTTPTSR